MYILLALTFERFISVCHPSWARSFNSCQRAYRVMIIIPIFCLVVYIPKIFEGQIVKCESDDQEIIFQKRDNTELHQEAHFRLYKWFVEVLFRIFPTIIITLANILIIMRYRRVCEKRTQMTLSGRRSRRKIKEERRLIMLLLTTSVLFLVCISPSVGISIYYNETYLESYSFQVFRACVNILEISNYSLIFYMHIIFSIDFRQTFLSIFCKVAMNPASVQPKSSLDNSKSLKRNDIGISSCNDKTHHGGSSTTTPNNDQNNIAKNGDIKMKNLKPKNGDIDSSQVELIIGVKSVTTPNYV